MGLNQIIHLIEVLSSCDPLKIGLALLVVVIFHERQNRRAILRLIEATCQKKNR
jgi:hypothetical protein